MSDIVLASSRFALLATTATSPVPLQQLWPFDSVSQYNFDTTSFSSLDRRRLSLFASSTDIIILELPVSWASESLFLTGSSSTALRAAPLRYLVAYLAEGGSRAQRGFNS